jgi:hypothetical protein
MSLMTIEAAHFYTHNDGSGQPVGFGVEQQKAINLALEVANKVGLPTQFMLFIDDYHGKPDLSEKLWEDHEIYDSLTQNSEVTTAMDYFARHGINPELISEFHVTTAAAYLYSLLTKKGVVKKGGRGLIDQYGGVALLTKEEQPTCALIDAALYLKKIGPDRSQPTITVLPQRFKGQQEQVIAILRAFGISRAPIQVIYHDELGNVCEEVDYSIGM